MVMLLVSAARAEDALGPARDAFVKGDYRKAIALAQPHVADNPGQAWRVIGASNCFLKDAAGAREAWGKLDAEGQAFLRYVCSRNKVPIP
jgi:hypothetical protein